METIGGTNLPFKIKRWHDSKSCHRCFEGNHF